MLRSWFGHPTMTDIDRQLPPRLRRRRRRRTLVVLADDPRQVTRLHIAESRWARARVVPLVRSSAAALHHELAGLTRVDVVVDARGSAGAAQLSAFGQGFFHLPPRG